MQFTYSRTLQSSTTKVGERGMTERAGDRGGPHKSVTMAPTSRYLTDRQYVVRKPLFSAEQHASILKKTPPLKHTEKEKLSSVPRREGNPQHTDMNFLTSAREELTPEGFSPSDISSPSPSTEDLGSSLAVSELRARLSREKPTFQSPFSGSISAQRSYSSSILEVQRLNPPLRPRLTSTVLNPTYTPRSRQSRPGQTQLRLGGVEGSESKLCSSAGHSKGRTMSPYEAKYWACAIPKALPPFPDRHSAAWDPHREYQALLDYTYPLKPGQEVTEWYCSELQQDSLLQTDPNLQDSGIELDHLCSSTSQSGQTRDRNSLSVGHRSPDRQTFSECSDGLPSSTLLSRTDPVGLSLDSQDNSKDRDGTNCYKRDGHHHQHHALSSCPSPAFIRSTRVLPQSRGIWSEVDEEFWPLPEQLEELQLLSRQVREVTGQLRRPVKTSWESLWPGTTSIRSSITLPDRQEDGDEGEEEETEVKELESNDQHAHEGKYEMGEEMSAAQTYVYHRDSM